MPLIRQGADGPRRRAPGAASIIARATGRGCAAGCWAPSTFLRVLCRLPNCSGGGRPVAKSPLAAPSRRRWWRCSRIALRGGQSGGASRRPRRGQTRYIGPGNDRFHTSTPIGRLFFRIMAALAEFDREGTLEGLAAARARGRVGGRPPGLTQLQLDQAQLMYDAGQHTAEEIAATFGVARGTLYRGTWPRTETAATASWSSTATPAPRRSTPTTAGTARRAAAPRHNSRPTENGGPSLLPAGPTSRGSSTSPTAPSASASATPARTSAARFASTSSCSPGLSQTQPPAQKPT